MFFLFIMSWLITEVGDFSCNSEKINLECAVVENDELLVWESFNANNSSSTLALSYKWADIADEGIFHYHKAEKLENESEKVF